MQHLRRSADQLSRLYVDYGVGQGLVYAKHLLRGDVHVARPLPATRMRPHAGWSTGQFAEAADERRLACGIGSGTSSRPSPGLEGVPRKRKGDE